MLQIQLKDYEPALPRMIDLINLITMAWLNQTGYNLYWGLNMHQDTQIYGLTLVEYPFLREFDSQNTGQS